MTSVLTGPPYGPRSPRSSTAAPGERTGDSVERRLGLVRAEDVDAGTEHSERELPAVRVDDEAGESAHAAQRPGLGADDPGPGERPARGRRTAEPVAERAADRGDRQPADDRAQHRPARVEAKQCGEPARRDPVECRQAAAVDERDITGRDTGS